MTHLTSPQIKETISVVSYNCLANDYLHYWQGKLSPTQQTYTQQPDLRLAHVVQKIQQLNADVVCLQEVSASQWTSYHFFMGAQGYVGDYAQFSGKPDGVATFFKSSKFKNAKKDVLSYSDMTGRNALFTHLTTHQNAEVDIANTHFQGGSQHQVTANNQIQALVQKVQKTAGPAIVCADCNFTPADPRFQVMNQFLFDALNGQLIPTSMNGTTPLRLDYIWHSASLSALSPSVCGNIYQFLTQAEPSDHVPVMASFDLPIPIAAHCPVANDSNSTYSATSVEIDNSSISNYSLNVRNKYPGTDLNPSFKRKIFNAFNAYFHKMYFSQHHYDMIAPHLEAMIDKADQADQRQRGSFRNELFYQIAFYSANVSEILVLSLSCANALNPSQNAFYNSQPHIGKPSFRFTLFETFNQLFEASQVSSFEVYNAIALVFSSILDQADQATHTSGGNFVSHVTSQIDQLPDGYAKSLLNNVMMPHSLGQLNIVPQTIVRVKTKDVPNNQALYIRGGAAGLSWTKGAPLNRLDEETWEFRTPQSFFGELEYKLVVNDDNAKWEEGANHKVSQGKTTEVRPSFNTSVLSPLQKTTILVTHPVPSGHTLFVSGNGPLGNWDRKVPLKGLGNNQWTLVLDGQNSGFDYKFRLDDHWEKLDKDRRLECGKKEQVSSIRF